MTRPLEKTRRRRTLLCLPLYVWTVTFVLLPLVYVAGVSFCERDASWGVTSVLTLENYRALLKPTYLLVFGESLLTALLSTALALLLGYPFAYGMARSSPRRRLMLMVLVVVPFWTSALVRTYGWMILLRANGPINAALQALGWIERPLKLLYNNGAVLLGLVYTLLPFMILPCFTALERMDWSTVEAARDLGATPWHAFYTVTLPLTRSGIMSGITLTFVPSMGIFYIAELLGGSKSVLLGNLIQEQLLRARNTPFGAALAMALLGFTALVLWGQRRAGGETSLF